MALDWSSWPGWTETSNLAEMIGSQWESLEVHVLQNGAVYCHYKSEELYGDRSVLCTVCRWFVDWENEVSRCGCLVSLTTMLISGWRSLRYSSLKSRSLVWYMLMWCYTVEGLRERTEHLYIFLFSVRHSTVLCVRCLKCFVYWWKGSVRF